MKVIIKLARSIEIIYPDDIIYISAKGSYSYITKSNGQTIKVSKNLSTLLSLFKGYNPLQKCHRSYIANVNFVSSVRSISTQKYMLFMQNNELIPLSLSNKKEFLKYIKDQC